MTKNDKSELNRREFLTWAAAAAAMLILPGCESGQPMAYAPKDPARLRPVATGAYASAPAVEPQIIVPQQSQPVTYIYNQPQVVQQPAPQVVRAAAPAGGKVSAMSRNSWGATPATVAKMKAMNGVTRITVHHEGSAKPNNDVTPGQVAETLRLIQSQHRKRMGAGDIGYHFIIDRTGTIWQGRDWNYQGAHTSGANSNNIGVMLLGNFEMQQPTPQQIVALNQLVSSLVRKYGLNPAKDIYGHCDFCNTQCPGRSLKPQVAAMRRGLRV